MQLILYSKAGCCLCEGLEAKIRQIQSEMPSFAIDLEVRDINSDRQWQEQYAYIIPVLCLKVGDRQKQLPPIPPRISPQKLSLMLQSLI